MIWILASALRTKTSCLVPSRPVPMRASKSSHRSGKKNVNRRVEAVLSSWGQWRGPLSVNQHGSARSLWWTWRLPMISAQVTGMHRLSDAIAPSPGRRHTSVSRRSPLFRPALVMWWCRPRSEVSLSLADNEGCARLGLHEDQSAWGEEVTPREPKAVVPKRF
jgi:hypothetical protein